MWSNNTPSSHDKENRSSTYMWQGTGGNQTMEAPLSPTTPTSDDEPQPMPQPPRSLSPVAENPQDAAQDAAEEREGTRDTPSWHRQYLEERALAVEAQEDWVDPWENWEWSERLKRYDWIDPTGDRRAGNCLPDGTRRKRVRGATTQAFFANKYGGRSRVGITQRSSAFLSRYTRLAFISRSTPYCVLACRQKIKSVVNTSNGDPLYMHIYLYIYIYIYIHTYIYIYKIVHQYISYLAAPPLPPLLDQSRCN